MCQMASIDGEIHSLHVVGLLPRLTHERPGSNGDYRKCVSRKKVPPLTAY